MSLARWSPLAAWQRDRLVFCAAALLLAAIIFGGGGAEGAFRNAWLEAGGALLLTAAIASHLTGRPLPREAIAPVWMLVATLLLIALQLVPLPPAEWTKLPGRETAILVAEAKGGAGWQPISLDPEATRRTGAALLLPAGLLVATLLANNRGLVMLARAIVLGALLSALLGATQVALGTPEYLAPYGNPPQGIATGLFANRNHQAQLMLLALVATGLLIRLEKPQIRLPGKRGEVRIHFGWLLSPLFIALAAAAQSRAGIGLLVPTVAAAIAIALNRKGLTALFALIVGAIAAAVAVFAISGNALGRIGSLQSTLKTDGRAISMPDILYTLEQYWPVGSGFGTFAEIFRANEDLDLLTDQTLNHAHNDYLELLVEAGAGGAALLAIAALLLALRFAWLVRGRSRAGRGPAVTGFAMLVLLLLHSIVDYPLRMDAIAAIAAVAVGFLYSPAQAPEESPDERQSRRRRKGFGDIASGFGAPRRAGGEG